MSRPPRTPACLSLCLLGLLVGRAAAGADAPNLAPLRHDLPAATVGLDARFGTVRSLTNAGATPLTGPQADAHAAVLAFVARYPDAFGDGQLLSDARVEREWTNPTVAVHTIVWQQQLDGVPVQDGRFIAHLRQDNAILALGDAMVPGARARCQGAPAGGAPTPRLSATSAIALALGALPPGLDQGVSHGAPGSWRYTAGNCNGPIDVQLVWAVAGSSLRLAWEVQAGSAGDPNRWQTTFDAATGSLLSRRSLTCFTTPYTTTAPAGASAGGSVRTKPRTSHQATPAWTPQAASLHPRLSAMTQQLTLAVYAPDSVFGTTPNDSSDITICGESPTPYLPGWTSSVPSADTTFPNTGSLGATPAGYPSFLTYPVFRQIFTQSGPTSESPDGWIDDNTTTSSGNNVVAGSAPNGGGTPVVVDGTGALGRDFQPNMNNVEAEDPTNYTAAAVVNLFYWDNFMHDRLYDAGFTEPAGNFQQDNFGLGGNQFDPVYAEAQFDSLGGAVDATFFSTGLDGSFALQGLMLYNGPTIVGSTQARRDSDLDATMICQSYGMGVATRLVGGGNQLKDLQPMGLASGWGDFISLALLAPAGSDMNAAYPIGAFAALDYLGTANYPNYYQGVRRYPTSTNTALSPYTLSELNNLVASNPAIVTDGQQPLGNAIPAGQGEIWCNALWQARADWLTLYAGPAPGGIYSNPAYQTAYKAANQQFLALVLAGMQLAPPEPTFTEARDALLLADTVAPFAGAEQALLWNAFTVRGLGPQAQAGPAMDTSMTQDLIPPGALLVVGGTAYQGGTPGAVTSANQSTVYTLRNLSASSLNWAVGSNQPWAAAAPASGTLAAGATTTVTIAPTPVADTLNIGQYNAVIGFTDSADSGTTRSLELDVAGTYIAAQGTYQWLSPVAQTTLPLGNNAFTAITLPFAFQFYSQPAIQLEVGANGLISFQVPSPNDALHSAFNVPLGSPFPVNDIICPLWWNLNPDFGGTISWGITGTPPYRVAVITWSAIPPAKNLQTPSGLPVTFQLQLQETTNLISFAYQNLQQAKPWGGGKYASVGVEDQRGILHTQWQVPGSVAIADLSELTFTYSVPPGFNAPVIGALDQGGSGQCGLGFGTPAVLAGSIFLVVRRLRLRRR
jgi:hypothetical protein